LDRGHFWCFCGKGAAFRSAVVFTEASYHGPDIAAVDATSDPKQVAKFVSDVVWGIRQNHSGLFDRCVE